MLMITLTGKNVALSSINMKWPFIAVLYSHIIFLININGRRDGIDNEHSNALLRSAF